MEGGIEKTGGGCAVLSAKRILFLKFMKYAQCSDVDEACEMPLCVVPFWAICLHAMFYGTLAAVSFCRRCYLQISTHFTFHVYHNPPSPRRPGTPTCPITALLKEFMIYSMDRQYRVR